MPKIADKYLKIDPWAIVEEGFDPQRNRVSESIFSLGNEYMGVRGYPEEGYSGDSLKGSYFNGLFEQMEVSAHYKGIIRSLRFMVNAVDWLYTRITIDGEILDLATSRISDYRRRLDFRTGTYSREFVWHLQGGRSIKLEFTRLVSMTASNLGGQRIKLTPLNFSGTAQLRTGLDFSVIHEDQGRGFWKCLGKGNRDGIRAMIGETANTGNRLYASYKAHSDAMTASADIEDELFIGQDLTLRLEHRQVAVFDKLVVNYTEKNLQTDLDSLWTRGHDLALKHTAPGLETALEDQHAYWKRIWETSDITIDGDEENQQGIRFCIFQLYQTYHGDNPGFNIGAKGLTGEAYRGLAFWDTESYCLPFYIFNNPKAAKSLLEFRYKSLPEALQRARDVDCEGAFYPIATIDGTESCDLWQHSNLQLHVGTAVAYGLWHYVKIVGDKAFLYEKGVEMLIQIARFYATRGQWGQKTGQYGYYGVMGPDEFQLMVNNNAYTNLLAKKMFEYTLESVEEMRREAGAAFSELAVRLELKEDELAQWKHLAEHMRIPKDEQSGIYEEHDGFFDMPHLDIHSIPVTDFPLYSNWSYDRLYRYDMIKQPDVLMFMFLYNQQFTLEEKRVNYEYYEPRCIHESSLSPSIHSILASELGKHQEAYNFFEFATRLDLDNYNRNTREGLHTTSIAAAWMNVVYGFGGMRSDGEDLVLNPSLPDRWKEFSFHIVYQGTTLKVTVERTQVKVRSLSEGRSVRLRIYGELHTVDESGVVIEVPSAERGIVS
ncbi:glycoside hydrolase family 65 protein [Paenibacillus tuaregi]|uniref:glycoside hydrolase family 65 protein n=1 Tax=Paenibacillus tuaregi TaxID=1816681 RepID=UPI000839347B|nr:glycosyl hydrolase family 65 protein [Paenibacillus tuaregi]